MPIQYISGDATQPSVSGNKIIAHVCNDVGGWGKGFVLAISHRWEDPEIEYKAWFRGHRPELEKFGLCSVQFVQVESSIWVANMIAQSGVGALNTPRVNLIALNIALQTLSEKAKQLSASIHMPKIGTGLGGNDWKNVEPVINQALKNHNVYIYTLARKNPLF